MSEFIKSLTVDEAAGGRMRFLITSGAIDRDQEILDPDGMQTDKFMANPVLLWCHDLGTPAIGKVVNLVKGGRGWEAEVEWAPEGVHPLADMVRKLYEAKILNAVSIRFQPLDGGIANGISGQDDYRRKYTKFELLELSTVNVPSNPEALRVRGMAGGEKFNEWLKSTGYGKANIEDYILQPGEPGGKPFTKEELLEMSRRYNDTPAKAGAELSKKNRTAIRSIRDRLRVCHDEIDEMVRKWADEEAEDEAEPAEEEEPKSVSVPTTPQDTPGAEPGAQSKTVDGEEVQDVRVIDLPILIDEAKIEELVRQRVAAGLAEADKQREDYLTGKSAVAKAMQQFSKEK